MPEILKTKMKLFDEMCIPWDKQIEEDFAREMQNPHANEETVADIVCHDYIEKAFENETETLHQFIKQKCENHSVFRKQIVSLIGKEYTQKLIAANLIKEISYSPKIYEIL